MTKIIFIDSQGEKKSIEVENGLTVMEGAVQNNIPEIDADCGGSMACAPCHVYVQDDWYDKLNKCEAVVDDTLLVVPSSTVFIKSLSQSSLSEPIDSITYTNNIVSIVNPINSKFVFS